jgi:hypothetical protein
MGSASGSPALTTFSFHSSDNKATLLAESLSYPEELATCGCAETVLGRTDLNPEQASPERKHSDYQTMEYGRLFGIDEISLAASQAEGRTFLVESTRGPPSKGLRSTSSRNPRFQDFRNVRLHSRASDWGNANGNRTRYFSVRFSPVGSK